MAQPRIVDAGQWSAPGFALFSYGFRPFFLFGALLAALALPLWLAMLMTGLEPTGTFTALRWHAHEMIFGYLAAIIAGFVLTAVPNWTGRFPLSGAPLAALVVFWAIGRVASWSVPSPLWALVLDGAFLVLLAAAIWREILAGRNYRNLPVALLVSLLALANLIFHMEGPWLEPGGYGERLALGAAAVLIGLIGGRITPSFTRNWMVRAGLEPLPRPFDAFDKLVMIATALAMLGWVFWPAAGGTGALLVVTGALHLVRLTRWQGTRTGREPIVLVLHLGYLWLAAALILLGLAALAPTFVSTSTALHALTAGAIGTMTLAVMTRASLGHTGRAITSSASTTAIYGLVTAGALLRVTAPFVAELYLPMLATGGLLWASAFGLFVIAYGPMLLKPGLGRIQ